MLTPEQLRLEASPGLHGANCTRCAYLFDAFDTPTPINDAIMRMKTTRCPRCNKRDKLFLLMPFKYREMVAAAIATEQRREAVRKVTSTSRDNERGPTMSATDIVDRLRAGTTLEREAADEIDNLRRAFKDRDARNQALMQLHDECASVADALPVEHRMGTRLLQAKITSMIEDKP